MHWQGAASVTNPLAVTQAYAARFAALGGVVRARRCPLAAPRRWALARRHRGGPLDAAQAVVALGPFAPDVLGPLGIRLPLGIKRGYHRHYRPAGNAALSRPVVDIRERLLPRAHGAGDPAHDRAEFAPRDAPPTPVQFDRLLPAAQRLFPLGEPVEAPLDGQPAVLPRSGR